MTSTATSKSSPKSSSGTVGEFITEARIDALNRFLADNDLDASQIITIFTLPAEPIANTLPARFRVLYRKH